MIICSTKCCSSMKRRWFMWKEFYFSRFICVLNKSCAGHWLLFLSSFYWNCKHLFWVEMANCDIRNWIIYSMVVPDPVGVGSPIKSDLKSLVTQRWQLYILKWKLKKKIFHFIERKNIHKFHLKIHRKRKSESSDWLTFLMTDT